MNSQEDDIDINNSDGMPVVAELSYKIEELTVEQAVMAELENESCIFRNAHSGLNLVYYRKDGNIGWVDPREVEKTSQRSYLSKSNRKIMSERHHIAFLREVPSRDLETLLPLARKVIKSLTIL